MQFDDDRLAFDPLAHVEPIEDQVEFGGQGLLRLEPRLAR